MLEDEMEPEVEDLMEGADGDQDMAGGTEDPDQHAQSNIVTSGDPSAAASGRGAATTVRGLKEKRISNEKRTTTPYMTKYERARVLGTRALQIRYVHAPNSLCKEEPSERTLCTGVCDDD